MADEQRIPRQRGYTSKLTRASQAEAILFEEGDPAAEMASMEERMASVEATLPHLATKADVANLRADIKDLEVRMTRLIYAVGVGILISIGLSLARLF